MSLLDLPARSHLKPNASARSAVERPQVGTPPGPVSVPARHARSAATRAASRSLLRGLLLGTEAPAVRRRRDESAVDRRHHRLRADGETRAVPRAGRAVEWARVGACRRMGADVGVAEVAKVGTVTGRRCASEVGGPGRRSLHQIIAPGVARAARCQSPKTAGVNPIVPGCQLTAAAANSRSQATLQKPRNA
jgi:hypothetical protein